MVSKRPSASVTCTNAFLWNLNRKKDGDDDMEQTLAVFLVVLVVLPVIYNILNAVEQQTR